MKNGLISPYFSFKFIIRSLGILKNSEIYTYPKERLYNREFPLVLITSRVLPFSSIRIRKSSKPWESDHISLMLFIIYFLNKAG